MEILTSFRFRRGNYGRACDRFSRPVLLQSRRGLRTSFIGNLNAVLHGSRSARFGQTGGDTLVLDDVRVAIDPRYPVVHRYGEMIRVDF